MYSANMSDKQKTIQATANILASVGRAYYKLPAATRDALLAKELSKIDQAILAQAMKQDIDSRTPEEKAAAKLAEEQEALKQHQEQEHFAVHPEQVMEPSQEFTERFASKTALAPAPFPVADRPLAEIEKPTQHKHESFSLSLTLNAKQTLAAEYAEAGKCFVLTGAAGTGKTTGCREIAKRLLEHGSLSTHDFKVPGGGGRIDAPSIAFCSYTNRATDNIRRALHKDPELEQILQHNVLTIHKLLEYEPVFYDILDPETNEMRTTMRFEPKRNAANPLHITHLVIEEASMLGIDLGMKLLEALPRGCQIIYVGDINQLPPVFGKSMLSYALILLPVVNLTEVYRQALESPIIENAHLCLSGKSLIDKRPAFQHLSGKALSVIPSESKVVNNLMNSLRSWYDRYEDAKGIEVKLEANEQADGLCRRYDPEQDIVLSPWNKGECGTTVLNNHIAQFLGEKRKALVFEILAGMRKVYLAVGDRVMINKQDGVITKISHNGKYLGRMARPASTDMTRFGVMLIGSDRDTEYEDFELTIAESGYAKLNVDDIPDTDEKKQEASHVVTISLDNGQEEVLSSIGDFAEATFQLGYALTVHKAQGCEWRKVIIVLHRNHAISLNRELLYTAITRARDFCILVDLCNMADKAIQNQRMIGDSIEEKIEWFNSEISLAEPVPVVPFLDHAPTELRPQWIKKNPVNNAFGGFVSQHAPVPLIKLADFVPESIRTQAVERLIDRWTYAQRIWGNKIGQIPTLSFDLQRSRVIGLAVLNGQQIKLNPLWCILAEKNEKVREEMLGDTLDHEICHLVAWNYSKDRGHDAGWRMAMKLMGRIPNVTADADALPSWTASYKDAVAQIKQDLQSKNADVSDQLDSLTEDEQA